MTSTKKDARSRSGHKKAGHKKARGGYVMKMHQNSKGQMTFTTKPPNDFWNEAILIAYLLEKHLWAIWDTCQVSPGHLRHVWRWLPGMGTRNVEGLPHENRKVRTGVCPASGPPSRVRTISQLSRCLYLPTHVKKQPVTQSLHRRIMNISRLSPRSRSICIESVMCVFQIVIIFITAGFIT